MHFKLKSLLKRIHLRNKLKKRKPQKLPAAVLILRYQIFNHKRKLLSPFRILSLKASNNHRENYKPKKSKKLNLSQRAFSRFQLAFHLIKSFLSPSVALIPNKRPIARKLSRSEFTKISKLSTDIGAQFMVGQLKTFTK